MSTRRRRQRGVQGATPPPPPAPYRDYLLQPYTSPTETTVGSIWNTPIGVDADEQPAGLTDAYNAAGKVTIDEVYFCFDPAAEVHPFSNGTRYKLTDMPELPAGSKVPADAMCHIPDSLTHDSSTNGITGLLNADDPTTAWTGLALNRLTSADEPQAYYTAGSYPTGIRGLDDLKGDGRKGAHGGGSCGGIGGAIRTHEYDAAVAGDVDAIYHRTALNVYGPDFLSTHNQGFGTGLSGAGWRWPAYRADANALTGGYDRPAGTFTGVVMGSLLALPADYDFTGITDPLVLALGWSWINFGIHIVDAVGTTRRYSITLEEDREAAFLARSVTTFHQKLMQLITDLVLIDDCSPTLPGGAGTPRVAPPLPLEP